MITKSKGIGKRDALKKSGQVSCSGGSQGRRLEGIEDESHKATEQHDGSKQHGQMAKNIRNGRQSRDSNRD